MAALNETRQRRPRSAVAVSASSARRRSGGGRLRARRCPRPPSVAGGSSAPHAVLSRHGRALARRCWPSNCPSSRSCRPELGVILVRLGYSEPCELRRLPVGRTARRRCARALCGAVTRARFPRAAPSDVWREGAGVFVVYPGLARGRRVDIVFAVYLQPRRPPIRGRSSTRTPTRSSAGRNGRVCRYLGILSHALERGIESSCGEPRAYRAAIAGTGRSAAR